MLILVYKATVSVTGEEKCKKQGPWQKNFHYLFTLIGSLVDDIKGVLLIAQWSANTSQRGQPSGPIFLPTLEHSCFPEDEP